MTQYLNLACSMVAHFAKLILAQVLRSENRRVNTLANLASNTLDPYHMELNVMAHPSISNDAILTTDTRDNSSWMSSIANYLKKGILVDDKKATVKTKARVIKCALINDILY